MCIYIYIYVCVCVCVYVCICINAYIISYFFLLVLGDKVQQKCLKKSLAPQVFTKLLKVSLAVLNKLNMLIITDNWSNQKKGGVDQGHSHLASETFRVASEFKEICALTMSGNRISGPYSKFCECDSLTALTQGACGPRGVHKGVQQKLDIDFGLD